MTKELKRLIDHYCEESGLKLEDLGELANVYHLDYEGLETFQGKVTIFTQNDMEKGGKYFLKRIKIPKMENVFTFYEISKYEYYKELVLYILK